MIDINELRRLAQAAMTGPDGVSLNWVKLLEDFQKEANPAVINELLDRLEESEADALEQARLNGMGASREAALMAKLEAAVEMIERMDGALESLLIRCDDSDSAMYGTLSTGFVRDTVRIARGEQE